MQMTLCANRNQQFKVTVYKVVSSNINIAYACNNLLLENTLKNRKSVVKQTKISAAI